MNDRTATIAANTTPYVISIYGAQVGWDDIGGQHSRIDAWDIAKAETVLGNPCRVYNGDELVWSNDIDPEEVESSYASTFDAAVFGVA